MADGRPATYADAVAAREVVAWLVAHPCPPMPEPERETWTRAVQLPLWAELERSEAA